MIATIPGFIKWVYPKRIWEGPAKNNAVYLTFDDGPIPGVTPWVLEQLKQFDAKATFFCIGENVEKHPGIFQKIISEGHEIGNHTYNHLDGWKTRNEEYLLNTLKARKTIQRNLPRGISCENPFFRPPYGKMTGLQAKQLQERGFKIVMWSVLSMDYYSHISEGRILKNVLPNVKPGSIIVFHDSLKAQPNLTAVLPKVLEHLSGKGYIFRTL